MLSELQAVCQRILASNGTASQPAALTTMASVANGTAVANSLEALRRQCVENNQLMAELKRSVDGHRGVVANDSAANGAMLVELRRSFEGLNEVVEHDRAESQRQMGELIRSVEALRVGLAGFSANNRQQVSELRGSLQSLEQTVQASGETVEHSLNTLSEQVEGALGASSAHVEISLKTLGVQIESALAGSSQGVQTALNTLGGQIQAVLGTLSMQISEALRASGEQVGKEMARQSAAYEALFDTLQPQETKDRLDELETMLSVGLPKFSEEIQASVQNTLLEVSRTFRLTEREHGNRMGELHRDFDASVRRLEASLQPRRREEPVT